MPSCLCFSWMSGLTSLTRLVWGEACPADAGFEDFVMGVNTADAPVEELTNAFAEALQICDAAC